MPDENAKRKKNDDSELSKARDLLRGWLRLPEMVAFLLFATLFLVWAFLRMTEVRDGAAFFIVFLVSGTAVGADIFLIVRQVRRTRALIQRINDMEREQARLATLADADLHRLEMPEMHETADSPAVHQNGKQKQSRL